MLTYIIALVVVLYSLVPTAHGKNSLSQVTKTIRRAGKEKTAAFFPFADNEIFPNRRLEDQQEEVCSPDAVFDDDENLKLFSITYDPECVCSEPNPFDEFLAENPTDNATDPVALVDALNEFGSSIAYVQGEGCANGCSFCFEEFCGVFGTAEATEFSGGFTSNFTLAELIGLASQSEEAVGQVIVERIAIDKGSFEQTQCLEILVGETGTVCFTIGVSFETDVGVGLDEVELAIFTEGVLSCSVTYNGDDCASCELGVNECIAVNCTNLVDGALTDTCTTPNDDFVGPFKAFEIVLNKANSTDFTLGTCDTDKPTPTLVLVESVDAQLTVPVVENATSAGDLLVWDNRLWSWNGTSPVDVIGTSRGKCTLVSEINGHCEWTLTVEGKGKLMVMGEEFGTNDFAVVGGTGSYKGATGELVLVAKYLESAALDIFIYEIFLDGDYDETM